MNQLIFSLIFRTLITCHSTQTQNTYMTALSKRFLFCSRRETYQTATQKMELQYVFFRPELYQVRSYNMFHTVDNNGPLSIKEIQRSLVFRTIFWKYYEKPSIFLSFLLPILDRGLLSFSPTNSGFSTHGPCLSSYRVLNKRNFRKIMHVKSWFSPRSVSLFQTKIPVIDIQRQSWFCVVFQFCVFYPKTECFLGSF